MGTFGRGEGSAILTEGGRVCCHFTEGFCHTGGMNGDEGDADLHGMSGRAWVMLFEEWGRGSSVISDCLVETVLAVGERRRT